MLLAQECEQLAPIFLFFMDAHVSLIKFVVCPGSAVVSSLVGKGESVPGVFPLRSNKSLTHGARGITGPPVALKQHWELH